MPAFNPAAAPTILNGPGSNSDVQISAVSSVGISAVSLRGFGPNRTLTLIDGRRAVPANALMVVDINSIPSSMIKRVEIISGGASAVYGADAMGGVSNFILRQDFEGLEVDAQYGSAEAGDNQEIRASAIMGTKVADGKGHIVVATEYYKRDPAYQKNRDFFTQGWNDPTVQGNFLQLRVRRERLQHRPESGQPGNASTRWQPVGPRGIACVSARRLAPSPSFRFNPDGTIFFPAGNNMASWKGAALDGRTYSTYLGYNTVRIDNTLAARPEIPASDSHREVQRNRGLRELAPDALLDHGDGVTTTSPITSSSSRTRASRRAERRRSSPAPTRASVGKRRFRSTGDRQPVSVEQSGYRGTARLRRSDRDCGPQGRHVRQPGLHSRTERRAHSIRCPADLAILLDSRGRQVYCLQNTTTCQSTNPNATTTQALVGQWTGAYNNTQRTAGWVAETYPFDSFGRRATIDEAQTCQIETGLRFDIPVKDWTGEVYYSRGESTTYNVAQGNNSLARWRAVTRRPTMA